MTNELKIKGHVTVEVVDRNGNTKQRVEGENNLSPAALALMIGSGILNGTCGLKTALGIPNAITDTKTTQMSQTLGSPQMGVYAMSNVVDWAKSWHKPPYVKDDLATLSDNVVFKCDNGSTSDTANQIASIQNRSYFDGNAYKVVAEYNKAQGNTGTFRSIGIGITAPAVSNVALAANKSATTPDTAATGTVDGSAGQPFGMVWQEALPTWWWTNVSQGTGTGFEQLPDRTIVWQKATNVIPPGGTTYSPISYDFLTRTFYAWPAGVGSSSIFVDNQNCIIRTLPDGSLRLYVLGNGTISTTAHPLVLYHKSISTSGTLTPTSTTFTQKAISDVPVTGTLNTARKASPTLVMNPLTGNLELFLSTDITAGGCMLVKGTVPANTADADDVVWTEVGRIPYVIGTGQTVPTGTTYTYGSLGFLDPDTGIYYLPYVQTVQSGTLTGFANTGHIMGVKLLPKEDGTFDASSAVDWYTVKYGNTAYSGSQSMIDWVKGIGGLKQIDARGTVVPRYINAGTVFSGLNLATPVTRGADDLLRIVYTYSLANS